MHFSKDFFQKKKNFCPRKPLLRFRTKVIPCLASESFECAISQFFRNNFLNFIFMTKNNNFVKYVTLAINCGDLTNQLSMFYQKIQNGPSFPSFPTEGATWNIICEAGFRWIDGSTVKTASCTSNLTWVYPAACVGQIFYLIVISK